MFVDSYDETEQLTDAQIDAVCRLLQQAADQLALSVHTECSVTFVSNERIQEINRDYRGKDQPTDVISFALDDEVAGEPPLQMPALSHVMPHNLGDILISVDRAAEQAQQYGHSFARELGFLAVHGFLHLNGYDHQTPEQEQAMFTLQETILRNFGLERDGHD